MGKSSIHCFAICAYKESPYLEACIQSLKAQTIQTDIIMATSTPNAYIASLAQTYEIPLYIRQGQSDIQADWNYAYDMAQADYVTIAHQDDVYHHMYVEKLLSTVQRYQDTSLFITDYYPIKGTEMGKRDVNSVIRHFLRSPLKVSWMADKNVVKKAILCMGNSICCPSVTYHKKKLGKNVFTSQLKYNLDWDTFYKYAGLPGRFAYVDMPLVYYRVHDGATSKEFIEDKRRVQEDFLMFEKFWPKCIASAIMLFYKLAYRTYG